jgi:hypothetical protein
MPLDREFERFRGGPNEALSKRVHVTISSKNLILLNRNAYILLGKPAAVYLNFSKARDVIAVEPTSPRLQGAFPVIVNGAGWRINAAPFCRHFNIDVDTTLKFVSPDIHHNAMFLNLAETISVERPKRMKKK